MMRIQRVFIAKDALNTDQRRDMTVFPRESPLIPVFGSNDTQTHYLDAIPPKYVPFRSIRRIWDAFFTPGFFAPCREQADAAQ
jgi:hypothetical protein